MRGRGGAAATARAVSQVLLGRRNLPSLSGLCCDVKPRPPLRRVAIPMTMTTTTTMTMMMMVMFRISVRTRSFGTHLRK